MTENIGFTDRLIRRAQALSPKDPFSSVAAEHLLRVGRLGFDDARGIWWLMPPSGAAQVATFIPFEEPGPIS